MSGKQTDTTPTTNTYAVVRARLANGRQIADADVVHLCDEIERLRAALRSVIELDEQIGAGYTDDASSYSAGLTACADIAREALQ